jgi:hypothetical protein
MLNIYTPVNVFDFPSIRSLPVPIYATRTSGEKIGIQRVVSREKCFRYFKKLKMDYSNELIAFTELKYALIMKDVQKIYRYLYTKINKELIEFEDRTKVVLYTKIPVSFVELSSIDNIIAYQVITEVKLGILDG